MTLRLINEQLSTWPLSGAADSDLVGVRGEERNLSRGPFRNGIIGPRLRSVVDDVRLTLRLTKARGRRRSSLTSRIGRSNSVLVLTHGIRQKRSHHRHIRQVPRCAHIYAS